MWVHLSQLPKPILDALDAADAPFRSEDANLIRVLREERLRSRVPALVQALVAEGLSTRQALAAVALHTGFSRAFVEKLYYATRRPQ